jgi:RNA polymerase sigma factor (sigma-70 family)
MKTDYLSREEQIDLVARMRAGDIAARDELVMSVSDMARQRATRWPYAQDREDIYQAMMLSLTRSLDHFKPAEWSITTHAHKALLTGYGSWLYWHDKHRYETSLDESFDEEGLAWADLVTAPSEPRVSDQVLDMQEALATIPARHREILETHWGLSQTEPVTFDEMAQRTGLSRQGVSSNEETARRRLAAQMERNAAVRTRLG